ncbi:putative ribose-phosphate pyrophosphokinase [Histomonas meleagridis]|uniref:putative ribose-phosphate pyrophosphokinase n=1 Tax=Histomonas meleagridis TaxID=135588 RepID=UPI00355AAD40|nr:putative ribose-phosphate pyrophosphokinase [Histomonas meleagridis]KAH0799067.1 putative ribose-phosphate pyrophosphokinase [Histomonas meleagridis]
MKKKNSADVVLIHNKQSEYFAMNILEELIDLRVNVKKLNVIRNQFSNGEQYYRLDIPTSFTLLGKDAVYVGAVTDDNDLMDLYRVGSALALAGIKRRIFVIPYLCYSSMDRAMLPGEVVTAKTNSQMLGLLGGNEGNIFIFIDLHYACLLHYFEGPCLRIELYAQNALIQAIEEQHFDMTKIMFGSTSLKHSSWVNAYAKALGCPISFVREKYVGSERNSNDFHHEAHSIVGEVKGFHILIYDDMIRSGKTVLSAAQMYLDAGATRVDVVTSHLACFNENIINELISSPIQKIFATNTHPVTQSEIVKNSDKFVIVDVSGNFLQCLYEILPTPEHLCRASI